METQESPKKAKVLGRDMNKITHTNKPTFRPLLTTPTCLLLFNHIVINLKSSHFKSNLEHKKVCINILNAEKVVMIDLIREAVFDFSTRNNPA
jgi:hypothetical protein